mgnify:FL=1
MTDDLKQRLRELSASRKPYSTGAHGQMVGMESYRIVANGFALECIDEAADRIEQLEAALRGMMDAYNDLCDESEPNYRSFKFRQEKWESANAALGEGKP